MKNKLKIVLLALALFSACSYLMRIDSDKDLEEKIRGTIISGKEKIDFKTITDFEWDSLIILTPYVSPERLGQELNVDFETIYHTGIDYRDDICLIVFYDNGEIINMVEYPRYPGDFANNENSFVKKEQATYRILLTNQKSTAGKDWIVVKLIE